MDDLFFMKKAYEQAKHAYDKKEVPVGAVVVKDGKVISRAYNRRETGKNAIYHAELCAIDKACKKLGGWRLSGCTLYVTLEPCVMCAGAIVNSRIDRVVIGTKDPKAGAMGSVTDVSLMPLNHKPEIIYGVMESECSKILKDFFAELRFNKKFKV